MYTVLRIIKSSNNMQNRHRRGPQATFGLKTAEPHSVVNSRRCFDFDCKLYTELIKMNELSYIELLPPLADTKLATLSACAVQFSRGVSALYDKTYFKVRLLKLHSSVQGKA